MHGKILEDDRIFSSANAAAGKSVNLLRMIFCVARMRLQKRVGDYRIECSATATCRRRRRAGGFAPEPCCGGDFS